MPDDQEAPRTRTKTSGRPLPPAWRRDWLKLVYYNYLNNHEGFTAALRQLFDNLEQRNGPYLFQADRRSIESLVALLAEAVRLAGDGPSDLRTVQRALRVLRTGGASEAPDMSSEIVRIMPAEERDDLQASVIQDIIEDVVSVTPDHPWRGRIGQPTENLRRQHSVDRAELEAVYRAMGERDWRRVAEEFERRHNDVWPDAGADIQTLVTDFCRRHALPTLRPLDDGPNDVWQTYRKWRCRGGQPVLAIHQRAVTSGPRPTLASPEVDPDGYEVMRLDTWRPEPETVYPPCLLPLKFSPYSMTVDAFMGVVDELWVAVRANLQLQAGLLASQAADWRPVNPEHRDVDVQTIRAERLYRHVAEGRTFGQLTRFPRGTAATGRSTVSAQVYSLAEQLGVDLSVRKAIRQ